MYTWFKLDVFVHLHRQSCYDLPIGFKESQKNTNLFLFLVCCLSQNVVQKTCLQFIKILSQSKENIENISKTAHLKISLLKTKKFVKVSFLKIITKNISLVTFSRDPPSIFQVCLIKNKSICYKRIWLSFFLKNVL